MIRNFAHAIALFLSMGFSIGVIYAEDNSTQITNEVTIVSSGGICPLARTLDGNVISLMGLAKRFPVNTKLKLYGRWVKRSTCQRGRTFQVSRYSFIKV
jgi:hypothetical protein